MSQVRKDVISPTVTILGTGNMGNTGAFGPSAWNATVSLQPSESQTPAFADGYTYYSGTFRRPPTQLMVDAAVSVSGSDGIRREYTDEFRSAGQVGTTVRKVVSRVGTVLLDSLV